MPGATLKCALCKESFPKDQVKKYKDNFNYCEKCYQEKENRAYFLEGINKIFDNQMDKAPPALWVKRKTLKEKYQYTDKVIVSVLDYMRQKKNYRYALSALKDFSPEIVNEACNYWDKEKIDRDTLERVKTSDKKKESRGAKLMRMTENKRSSVWQDTECI